MICGEAGVLCLAEEGPARDAVVGDREVFGPTAPGLTVVTLLVAGVGTPLVVGFPPPGCPSRTDVAGT